MNKNEIPNSEDGDMFSHLDDLPEGQSDNLQQDGDSQSPDVTGGTIRSRQLPNGIQVFEGSEAEGYSPENIFQHVSKHHKLYWLVNGKQAGINIGDDLANGVKDQLEEFPAEISGENSLHVFPSDNPHLPAIVGHCLPRDAAVCIASESDHSELLESMKTSLSFFAKPSSLWFQIQNANEFVLEQLFLACEFIFLQLKPGAWTIVTPGKKPTMWQEIGLPVEPSRM